MSIIDALDQQRYWVGQDGRRYEVATMNQVHRQNLLEFLRRNAEKLARHRDRHVRERGLTVDEHPELFAPPADWVENSPFVRTLKTTIALEEVLDGELTAGVTSVLDELADALRQRRRWHDDGADGR